MLERWVYLVLEFVAVDRAATSPGAGGIAGLYHEVGDDTVEYYVVVVAALGKACKILAGLLALVEVDELEGDRTYLGRVVIVKLYDNGALFNQLVNGCMAGQRASDHCRVERHIGRHVME